MGELIGPPDENERFLRYILLRLRRRASQVIETSNPAPEIVDELALARNLAQGAAWFGEEKAREKLEKFADNAKDLTGEGIEERIKDADV